jgi:hypothetical protein
MFITLKNAVYQRKSTKNQEKSDNSSLDMKVANLYLDSDMNLKEKELCKHS